MNNIRKVLSVVIVTFTILTLISCGVNNKASTQMALRMETTAASYVEAGFSKSNYKLAANTAAIEEVAYAAEYDGVSGGSNVTDRKIVKTVSLNTETKKFDESVELFKSYVGSFNGIIDSSYIDSGNVDNRNYRKNANFNVRIPAEKLDSFLDKIGNNLNVTFRQENISDITEEYSDTESRLNSLKIEEESLNSMLKKAKTVEEMIKVEDKLSSVRTEIENITRRLKRYDKQVTYSTVNVSITEVKDLTELESIEDDFSKETLVKQLQKNFEAAKTFVIRLGANIFTHIPWIILGLVAILVLLIITAIFKAIFGSKKKIGSSKKEKTKENDKSEKEAEVEVEIYQEEGNAAEKSTEK